MTFQFNLGIFVCHLTFDSSIYFDRPSLSFFYSNPYHISFTNIDENFNLLVFQSLSSNLVEDCVFKSFS